ncbi:MAG: hypothetical protein NC336_09905 [Clostridium sp.]|nr:hypothetical protein [Clostridium sp.]
MVKFFRSIITLLVVFLLLSGCADDRSGVLVRDIELVPETVCSPESICLTFNFYPERWISRGDTLWILNSRDSLFLTGYDMSRDGVIAYWGKTGGGPGEYVSPGLVEGDRDGLLSLYGNTENKIVRYITDSSAPVEAVGRDKMPV